ncbi:MAG: CotH kinase family protein [Bacteroidales bacterium]|nr:CotH kinase family protein [Bacteroidales bacterium]
MKRHSILLIFLLAIICAVQGQIYFPEAGQAYRTDVLPRIDITIDEDSLQWIYDNVESMKEFKALFIYSAGSTVDTVPEVGFRLRGNTSRQSAKKSFKVSFNTFTPGGKFYGIEKMNLNGEHNDPSIIRSHLTWNLFRQMKVAASRSNPVDLYINGRYYGLYINVEHVDEEFAESRFGNKLGNLYKCTYPASLTYLGDNPDDYKNSNYELKTNTEKDDYSDLINFIYTLNNVTPEQFPAEIEPIFNVNGFLRYLAVEIFTGHWDGYSYLKNNFYLFNNLISGKFEFVPYDVDNTFGIDWFGIDWANRDIYNWWNGGEARPLTSKIFENQVYKDRFSFFLNELVTQYATTGTYFPVIDAIKSKIDASAEADEYRTYDYNYSFDDYNRSYTEALGAHVKYGLKPYITTRINSINQQLDLNPIAPIIENVYHSFPQLNQPVLVHLNITDDQADPSGELFYSVNDGAFNAVPLAHGTENKYIAEIPALTEPGTVKYYIEAADAGMNTTREPSYGDYAIHIGVSDMELMITEFMAGNGNTIVDNYGASEDWIEIRNTGNETVSLAGKYLTDDLQHRNKFALPDVSLEPGEHYLIWADSDREQGPDHAGFKLNAGGESIGLFDSYEADYAPIHTLDYSAQATDVSSGINTSGEWVQQTFITPMGENNSADVAFVTFRFNMNKEIGEGRFNPANDFIDVAGTFNGWNGDVEVHDGNEDGIYQYTAFGFTTNETIEYKARINADWSNAEFPELGGEGNRVYTLVSGHNILNHWYNETETGINDAAPGMMLTVFPNPAPSGNFVANADFNIESVVIYTLTGTVVYQKETGGTREFRVHADLDKGIYLLRVSGDDREWITRIVVY